MPACDHVLRTERLLLSPVRPADHGELLAHWTAPDVRRFLFDGAVMTPQEVTDTIEDSEHTFAASGHGLWTVREHGREPLTGTAGLRPLDDLGLEIVYSLAPHAWGHGYATEAARAVVEHALNTLGLPEVFAEVDEGNTASTVVIERLGMTPFTTVPGLLGPMIRYRRGRGD